MGQLSFNSISVGIAKHWYNLPQRSTVMSSAYSESAHGTVVNVELARGLVKAAVLRFSIVFKIMPGSPRILKDALAIRVWQFSASRPRQSLFNCLGSATSQSTTYNLELL